ncbi:MAG: AAA family ATPase [Smithella sp.]|jgi:type II secretory pathway predicted ATPase ExeA
MGRPKVNEQTAYEMAFVPLILKELCVECGISQAQLGKASGLSRAAINLVINRGYIPKEKADFKYSIEIEINKNRRAVQWLNDRKLTIFNIWNPLGKDLRNVSPAADNQKMWETRKNPAMVPGNPEQLKLSVEVEMIKPEAMKYFKMFRNPFIDDVLKESDIYMSEEHRYIEAAMLDAARHGGFLAVIGEVGSGKSVMRRKVVEQLRRDGDTIVIFPQMIDKNRVNAASICDAIIMDLSETKPAMKLETKARQVHKLLLERAQQNFRAVLIIEEAHDLNINTLKYLKRFYELEDGYRKLLGIILIGQTELKSLFNETKHIEMREVIRRIQVAEIKGLNGNTKDYLNMKFKRVGVKIEDIFEDAAFKALTRRLTIKDSNNKAISHAYPLMINNYAAKAITSAYELGEKKVTEELVMKIESGNQEDMDI